MARTRVLVDSNFFYALNDRDDRHHKRAITALQPSFQFITIESAIAECAYLLTSRISYDATIAFLGDLALFERVPLMTSDLERARAIMVKYADAEFDFVDSCLMALSERLNIITILTFDRRDFSLFRPAHADHLTLLP